MEASEIEVLYEVAITNFGKLVEMMTAKTWMRPIWNLPLLRFTERQSVLKRRAFWMLLYEQ